jgi:hypothetical protein
LLLPAEPEPEATPERRGGFRRAVGVGGGGTEYIAAARRTAEEPRSLLLLLLRTRRGLAEYALRRLRVAVGAPTAEQRAAPGVEGWERGRTSETARWFGSTKQPTPTRIGVVSEKATRRRLLTLLLLLGVPKKASPGSRLALLRVSEEPARCRLGLLLATSKQPRTGTLRVRVGATAE